MSRLMVRRRCSAWEILAFVVQTSLAANVMVGCDSRVAANNSPAPELRAKQEGILNEAISLWDLDRKDDAVSVYRQLAAPNGRPWATGSLAYSASELHEQSSADEDRNYRETMASLKSVKQITTAVLRLAKERRASGDTNDSNELFAAAMECGRALDRPGTLTQLDGKAISKAATEAQGGK